MPSQELYRFAYSTPVRRYIDVYGCGWQDGGCFIFAIALCLWLGADAQLGCLYREEMLEEQDADHWFCRLGSVLIDSDGTYSPEELMDKWNRLLERRGGIYLEIPAAEARSVSELKNAGFSTEIAKLLSDRFGKLKEEELSALLGKGV